MQKDDAGFTNVKIEESVAAKLWRGLGNEAKEEVSHTSVGAKTAPERRVLDAQIYTLWMTHNETSGRRFFEQ
jgi:hypothetical protein